MSLIHERVELTVENHVAHVTLSRAEKMNALDVTMLEAIPMLGEKICADSSIRAVVLSGAGGNFCSGLDKSNFAAILNEEGLPLNKDKPKFVLAERTHGISNALQYVAWMWRELPMPVLVAINGAAYGGGLQIALAGDCRYAAPDSTFSILEMKWGLIPDMSSTQTMRHLVRDDIIRELTYTAKFFTAEQAKEWGFITDIVDDPVAHALSLANEIANKNPDAIRASKKLIEAANYQTAEEGLLMESVEQDKVIGQANQIEAVVAQMESRQPKFKD